MDTFTVSGTGADIKNTASSGFQHDFIGQFLKSGHNKADCAATSITYKGLVKLNFVIIRKYGSSL